MRCAYADPPYLSRASASAKCSSHYPEHAESKKWDSPAAHLSLIDELVGEYPEGWALSCSSSTLQLLLPHCPDTTRVLAWVKPWCVWRGQINPAYSWEPVLMFGGRSRKLENPKVRDYLVCNAPIKQGTVGAKPPEFAFWIFQCLGLRPEDELADIFPGSGGIGETWSTFQAQQTLFGGLNA